jgi:hypothetical protein
VAVAATSSPMQNNKRFALPWQSLPCGCTPVRRRTCCRQIWSRALASMNINLDKADLQEQIAAADKYWYSVVRDSNDVTSLGKLLSERWQDPALWQDAARERGARPCAAPPTAKHPDDYKPQCH